MNNDEQVEKGYGLRVTVIIDKINVTIDRPGFKDGGVAVNGPELRTNIIKDTIIPTLTAAVEQAKCLYLASKETSNTDKTTTAQ